MYAELRDLKFLNFRAQIQETAAMTSTLIVGQQDLKKYHVKPSGPDALSEGNCLIVAHTSSSEKGASRAARS
jgi:hypothetical protein